MYQNSLHKLVEQFDEKRVKVTLPMAKNESKQKLLLMTAALAVKKAVCFDMGDVVDVFTSYDQKVFFKLPYPVCWFEGDPYLKDGAGRTFGFLCTEFKEKIFIFCFGKSAGEWVFSQYIEAPVFVGENGESNISVYPPTPLDVEMGSLHFTLLSTFLSVLNGAGNIKKVLHEVPLKMQKAREKRGKKPFFDSWTLEIDVAASKAMGIDCGGTHASPRVHLRRGHMREYQPGKFCWVPSCVVGDKSLGMIHKDYATH